MSKSMNAYTPKSLIVLAHDEVKENTAYCVKQSSPYNHLHTNFSIIFKVAQTEIAVARNINLMVTVKAVMLHGCLKIARKPAISVQWLNLNHQVSSMCTFLGKQSNPLFYTVFYYTVQRVMGRDGSGQNPSQDLTQPEAILANLT